MTDSTTSGAQGGYRVLAIHAHPDDESSKGAATMARYIDEGHRVRVLTCTGGEEGSILNPRMDRPEVHENLAAVRREEMARAAEILGVEHRWLGYVDSGLPESGKREDLPDGCFSLQDVDEVVDNVVAQIREFQPHVIITYDENGGYPHPDHLMVHAVSMRAWDLAGDPEYRPDLGVAWAPLKLYYTHGFVVTRFNMLAEAVAQRQANGEMTLREYQRTMTQLAFWRAKQDVYPRVTTRVNAADWFERRDAALTAHATQIDPDGPFFGVDVDVQRETWPTEEFELAKTRVATTLPERELTAGLPPVESADELSQGQPSEVPVRPEQ